MNLHEYQSKELFRNYGIPVPNGKVAFSAGEAVKAAESLTTAKVVVKAQVHAGGRGKAGGVKLVDTPAEAGEFAGSLLGTNLVTFQTDENGQPINRILVEETCDIANELYLGAVLDRSKRRVVIMASTEGGVEIEKVAHETPEKILKATINPLVGIMPYQCRELAFGLGLSGDQIKQFTKLLTGLGKLVNDKDLDSILPLLPREASYYFTRSSVPRSLDPAALREAAKEHGLEGKIYESVAEAYSAADEFAGEDDMIFTGGSTFVVADLLDSIG